jgi:hypothetical protein
LNGNSKNLSAIAIIAIMLLSTFAVFALTTPLVKANPSLPSLANWPVMFASRNVLMVAGDSVPHGAYNVGAASADNLALTDVASVMPGSAVTQTRLDQEIMNYPSLTYKATYTTQDVVSTGGPVVNTVMFKYSTGTVSTPSFATAPCWFDQATWNIVTATGHSYSDPQGRHAMITLYQDGTRQILLAEGFNAYGTRAAGVILKNYAAHTDLLQGACAVFIPSDSNLNGIWEQGEGIQLLEVIKRAEMSVSSNPSPLTLSIVQGGTDSFTIAVSEIGGQNVGLTDGTVAVTSGEGSLFGFSPTAGWNVPPAGTTTITGTIDVPLTHAVGAVVSNIRIQSIDASTGATYTANIAATVNVQLRRAAMDVSSTPSPLSFTTAQGVTSTFNIRVTETNNLGVALINGAVSISGTGTLPVSWTTGLAVSGWSVASGGTRDISGTVTPPMGTADGAYSTTLTVQSTDQAQGDVYTQSLSLTVNVNVRHAIMTVTTTPSPVTLTITQGASGTFNINVADTWLIVATGLHAGAVQVLLGGTMPVDWFVPSPPNGWTVAHDSTTVILGTINVPLIAIAPATYTGTIQVSAVDDYTGDTYTANIAVTVNVVVKGGLEIFDPASGIWDTVQPPTWDNTAPYDHWPPGTYADYSPNRLLVGVRNTGTVSIFNLAARVPGTASPWREFAYAAGSTLDNPSVYTDPATGVAYTGSMRLSPWQQTLLPSQEKRFDVVASIPPDMTIDNTAYYIRANSNDTGGAGGMDRKTVYNIDTATPIVYMPKSASSIRTAMTYNVNPAILGQVSLTVETVPVAAPFLTSISGVTVPNWLAGEVVLVGFLYEDTMAAILSGNVIDQRLAVVFYDSALPGGAGVAHNYDTYLIDRNAINSVVGETPVLFPGYNNNAITMVSGFPAPLTVALWYFAYNDTDANGFPSLGDFGFATFIIADDLPDGLIPIGGLLKAVNVELRAVNTGPAGAPNLVGTGVPGGALRRAVDAMQPYNYYLGSLTLQGDTFYHIITIDPTLATFPVALAAAPFWYYNANYADLDGDGQFEAGPSGGPNAPTVAVPNTSSPETVEGGAVGQILPAGPYASEPGIPAGVLQPIFGDDLVYGVSGAGEVVEILQIVREREGADFIPGNADDPGGSGTLNLIPPTGASAPLFAVGLGPDNTLGTADDISFPATPVTFLDLPNDIPQYAGAGDLNNGVGSAVYSLDSVVYAKTIPEDPTPLAPASGDEVDWNRDGDTLDTFYALVVPRLNEAVYGATDLNADGDTLDSVDSVFVDDPTFGVWPATPSWADDLLGLPGVGNQLATGYQTDNAIHFAGAVHAVGAAHFELFYIHYNFGIDTTIGTADDTAGFAVIGNTSPVAGAPGPFSVNNPGPVDVAAPQPSAIGAVKVSYVSSPTGGAGTQTGRSIFTTIWGLADSGHFDIYTSGFDATLYGATGADDKTATGGPNGQPAPITFWSPMWTYFTGDIQDQAQGAGPGAGNMKAIVLRDSTTDGTFDTVTLDENDNGNVVDGSAISGVVGTTMNYTPLAGETGYLQIYQIIYSESTLTIGGPIGIERLLTTLTAPADSRDLNNNGNNVDDIFVLYSNYGPTLGDHISEQYLASRNIAAPFAAGGDPDSPMITVAARFEVSIFKAGMIRETTLPIDLNNDNDMTDRYDEIKIVNPGTQDNTAIFPNGDNYNRAVVDENDNYGHTDNPAFIPGVGPLTAFDDGVLSDNAEKAEAAFVTFSASDGPNAGSSGSTWGINDIAANGATMMLIIPSGTYTVVITIEGNVDTNGNGVYDAGIDQYISVTLTVNIIFTHP